MIIIYLQNGHSLHFQQCDFRDFEELSTLMANWRNALKWRNIWIRKKDIYSFELTGPL
jgi:hypothetical protein